MNPVTKFFPKSNSLPIDKFIYNALYKKNLGYYAKKNPIGKKGDFITAPEISFLFSEMIAVWVISLWEHLGKPKDFNIVELGPGSGKMCFNMIRVFKKFPSFLASCNIFLYEKSPTLKKLQQKNLSGERINWINNFDKIKSGKVIFLGNEFFDAIPIKQFKIIKNKIYEKYVKLENDYKIKSFYKRVNSNKLKVIKKYNCLKKNKFIEYPKEGLKELKIIIRKIKQLDGGLVLFDYGFLNPKNNSSLQSLKDHKKNNMFTNVGNADITSLVNFSLLKEYFENKNLKVNDIVTQEFFLKRVGILERAEIISKKMSFREKSNLYLRLQRLLNPKQMGQLFKVIFAFKFKKNFLLGFN